MHTDAGLPANAAPPPTHKNSRRSILGIFPRKLNVRSLTRLACFQRVGRSLACQVDANLRGTRAVKEERGGRLNRIPAQFIPRISFREDVLRQALGTVPTIAFLDNLEHQLSHCYIILITLVHYLPVITPSCWNQ